MFAITSLRRKDWPRTILALIGSFGGYCVDMAENPSDELARELQQTRERLSKSVDDLQEYVRPSNVANRGLEKVSSFFVTEDGQPRTERIAAVSASVLAFFGLALKSRGKKDN
ncbi:MAG: DUF3618 domain-containing protein [Actinobacteria bacterium]|nr:DUF3618 domain-containing protein [Actinomycetota bacterium]NBY15214.1 DUF3618 domain-containing protein [Actinomycetota bacterium]